MTTLRAKQVANGEVGFAQPSELTLCYSEGKRCTDRGKTAFEMGHNARVFVVRIGADSDNRPGRSSKIDRPHTSAQILSLQGLRQMTNYKDAGIVLGRQIGKPGQDRPDFIRPVHIDAAAQVGLHRIHNDKPWVHFLHHAPQDIQVLQRHSAGRPVI